MKALKLTVATLVLTVTACSPKTNLSKPNTPPPATESKSQQDGVNNKEAEKYLNSGISRFKQGDYQGGIVDFTKAIEINPNYAEAYSNRGSTRIQLKDYQAAINDFNKAIEINPNLADAYHNRGITNYALG